MSATLVDLALLSPVEKAELRAILDREVRDKSYELLPLGQDVAAFMAAKRQRYSPNTAKAYESSLDKLARYFADLRVEDFEPPIGTERLTEYLDRHWGDAKSSTYNVHLSASRSFFGFMQDRGRLNGDPTRGIDRGRKVPPDRHVFTYVEYQAMLAAANTRDRIVLHLMFDYGLRQGSVRAIRYRHFEASRRRLAITVAKGGKTRSMPLPDPELWLELEQHILEVGAMPDDLLLCVERPIPNVGVRRFPDQEMSRTTAHRWFYDRQADAGLVGRGEYGSGRARSWHVARHTAAQWTLDATSNIVAVQKLLGHSSIATTQEYVGMGEDELARVLTVVFAHREGER